MDNVFLLCIIIIELQTPLVTTCRVSSPVQDNVLVGHVIKTVSDKSLQRCIQICELEKQCYSINYDSTKNICELNKATMEWLPSSLVQRTGAVYLSMVVRRFDPLAIPSPLGMESGHIKDSLISASSSRPGYEPYKGRLHGNSCWIPTNSATTEYFTVVLWKTVNLTHIATQGDPEGQCWITQYSLETTYDQNDPNSWSYYKENGSHKVFQGNTDGSTTIKHALQPFLTVIVRVHPIGWHRCIGLRLELYGIAVECK